MFGGFSSHGTCGKWRDDVHVSVSRLLLKTILESSSQCQWWTRLVWPQTVCPCSCFTSDQRSTLRPKTCDTAARRGSSNGDSWLRSASRDATFPRNQADMKIVTYSPPPCQNHSAKITKTNARRHQYSHSQPQVQQVSTASAKKWRIFNLSREQDAQHASHKDDMHEIASFSIIIQIKRDSTKTGAQTGCQTHWKITKNALVVVLTDTSSRRAERDAVTDEIRKKLSVRNGVGNSFLTCVVKDTWYTRYQAASSYRCIDMDSRVTGTMTPQLHVEGTRVTLPGSHDSKSLESAFTCSSGHHKFSFSGSRSLHCSRHLCCCQSLFHLWTDVWRPAAASCLFLGTDSFNVLHSCPSMCVSVSYSIVYSAPVSFVAAYFNVSTTLNTVLIVDHPFVICSTLYCIIFTLIRITTFLSSSSLPLCEFRRRSSDSPWSRKFETFVLYRNSTDSPTAWSFAICRAGRTFTPARGPGWSESVVARGSRPHSRVDCADKVQSNFCGYLRVVARWSRRLAHWRRALIKNCRGTECWIHVGGDGAGDRFPFDVPWWRVWRI